MGRDEGIASFLIQMLFRFLLNLIVGVFTAVVTFVFMVWSIISSYRPDAASAALFFLGCALAAASFFMTFVVCVAGATTVAVAGMMKAAQVAIENSEAEQRRRLAAGGTGRYRQE